MVRLIIDTDPGVDDAFALTLAARSPEVDLLAVTTVFGNVGLAATTRNALRVLALCGREDVPVGAGAARPLVYPQPFEAKAVHGEDGLSGRAGFLPPHARGAEVEDAVTLLARVLDESPEPVTVAPIGPLTNIALLLAAHPHLKQKIDRLVIMGGGLRGGNSTPAAEFNLWCDPEAARRVLVEEDVPAVLVPIDLTYRCAVDGTWLTRLRESGPLGEELEALTTVYRAHYNQSLGFDGTVLHDAVAVAEAISPGILTTTRVPIHVDTSFGQGRGSVIADRRLTAAEDEPGFRPVDIALETDLDGLREFILDGLR
ncbi:nucleoside hydrolase [Actinokineospora iranica]|uniref:Pyrimidine-specific ribonucleoside hydrolase n=1 Tax=Actinokineospora iranica TaxID=1271860 RepID=A0A1G6N299_9PSEU|nr:nucleoside hydrolase [Actinokineospora iranica]SDC61567.1 pyrimidine-specific ribonucleoside hydrolase [Actinokineospora iranica]